MVPPMMIEPVPVHMHQVQFYTDGGFLAEDVARFIAAGLERGHAGIVIATAQHWRAIRSCLRSDGIDTEELIAEGQLTFADAARTLGLFMSGDVPEAAKFEASVAALVRSKLADYSAIDAYGEMVDLLSAAGNHTGALALEELWNELLVGKPVHLLCGYRIDRFNRDAHRENFRHICRAHTHVLPTEQFTRISDGEAQRRVIAELQQQATALKLEVERRKEAEVALKERTEDLERSNEELQRFGYVAAHDLQEPLRMISQYMDLVRQRGGQAITPEVSGYIDHAVHGANRMRDLIDALLVCARVGHVATTDEIVDLNDVMLDVRQALSRALGAAGASLSYANLPTVTGDAAKLSQLFQNLIGNALKYRSSAPPEVVVSAMEDDGRWVVSVRDNGIGIDAAHHREIFNAFQRLHRQETIPGTGIGLAICKRIVEQHGGQIWVESMPGAGSTFHFSIPI
jgi:signal transduction histidine kinase